MVSMLVISFVQVSTEIKGSLRYDNENTVTMVGSPCSLSLAIGRKFGSLVVTDPPGGARSSSVVRAFAYRAMARRIDPAW